MTTPAAARLYEAQHLMKMDGKGYAVFNPHGKPVAELPVIYGFNNGGSPGWFSACLVAEDGTGLGGHLCSSEGYMTHDLGILEGTRPDRHESFREHYPDGYRMEFVSYADVPKTPELLAAFEKGKALQAASADRSPKGGDHEDGRHAEHESAVAKPDAQNTPPESSNGN